MRRRFVRENPTEHVRGLREPATEVDPLDPDMAAAFLEACPPWWRPYFTVAFWTGARPNELAALKWGDVDPARGILRIRAGRYRGQEGPPKTARSVRDIDLLPAVVESLKAQKAQQAAERLKHGRGAPEAGHDYVLTDRSPEMLFRVYARYIPNRTRRDGSALLSRMTERTDAETADAARPAVLPKYSR